MPQHPFPTSLLWAGRIAVLAFFIALPLVYPQKYVVHVASAAMVFGVAALALQLLLGFAGLLSIGQAAFLGIGAYTSALVTYAKLPFELGFLAAGVVCGIASLALVPITRLRGVYLAVATLGFTIIIHLVILNEEWLTGGSFGFLNIPWPSLGPWSLKGEARTYYLCLAILVVTYIALQRLVSGRFGRALKAIMLDEDAARASGINVTLYKSQVLVIASALTGLAGSLFAHHNLYLNPNDFTFWKSIEVLVMVAVGGIGSLAGAVLGAFVMTVLPEYLRVLDDYRMVIFGAMLILFMGLGQAGLAGLFARGVRAVLERFDRRKAASEPALSRGSGSMSPVLETRDVTRRFGGLVAVDNVSMTVERQEVRGVIGPNGAGKTTLLNLIGGFFKPSSGAIDARRRGRDGDADRSPRRTRDSPHLSEPEAVCETCRCSTT